MVGTGLLAGRQHLFSSFPLGLCFMLQLQALVGWSCMRADAARSRCRSFCRHRLAGCSAPCRRPQASLQMGEAAFAGKYEPSKDGLDCIAIFDGTGFRLELLSATVKHLRCAGPRLRAGAASGPVPPMTLSLAHASPGGCRMLCTGPGGGLEEARY